MSALPSTADVGAKNLAAGALGSRTNRGTVERMDWLDEKRSFGYILVGIRAAKRFGRMRDASPGSRTWRCGLVLQHASTASTICSPFGYTLPVAAKAFRT